MRLHRLEVEGFGPFRARQIVDFDAFADDGIFLIAGRTGAGKSSILDAVCFGLYGGVPRYEGGEKRSRSDHCEPDDPSEVVVEFSTPSGRYRVTRSPEYLRPARRGGGMTKQAAAVSLEESTASGWVGRAARAVDVAQELDEILQLSREQFLQVILLAQNRFSEFLLAGSRDRQSLLRRLFGTERFEDVQARFDERRRQAEQALGSRLATVVARLEEAERLVTDAGLGGENGGGEDIGGETTETATTPTVQDRLDALGRALARAEYRSERRVSERADAERRSAEA
ncbi:AAA family ATPase, partial [Microbacterium sp. K41]|uniref:AAA family ATPase n=1 Tax=Microbacterium sp. K41 TaxID=2305437 RepID=UPI00109D2445